MSPTMPEQSGQNKQSPSCLTSSHGSCVSDSCPIRADWLLTVRASDGTLVDISGPRPWCLSLAHESSSARPLAPGDLPTLLVACAHWIPASSSSSSASRDTGSPLISVRVSDASGWDLDERSGMNGIHLRVSAAGIIDLALICQSTYPSVVPALFGKHIVALVGACPTHALPLLGACARAARSGKVEQVVVRGSLVGADVDLGLVRVCVRAVPVGGGQMAVCVVPALSGDVGEWERELRAVGMVVMSEDMFPVTEDEWVVAPGNGEYLAVEDEGPMPSHKCWNRVLDIRFWVPALNADVWRSSPDLISLHITKEIDQAIDLLNDMCVAIRGYLVEYTAYLAECANQLARDVRAAVQSVSGGWMSIRGLVLVLAGVVG
ncbi:hypothetical protein BCR44DRAFT_1426252 [Catenaria anguillulae PL171]|uniref:Uncharacterized protein n=1 Tax=Catenaria anguillulae PL171 TaxID=765915 RepID=A0A1Y2I2C4_9FUNG|nr:hypothetical protein BCR44DRAFT_1426252 [Catenaria anguillulae PL171]